jgi:hypothetical protein
MSFTGNEGEQISLEKGAELTARYRSNHPDSTKGMFVGREHIEAIFAQGGCKGLRMYLGQNTDGGMELVIVGADSNGDDMLNIIVDKTVKCPTVCGGTNVLNSDNPTRR